MLNPSSMVYELIDKYYKNAPELKQILITHSEQVRDRALAIVDAHPEWTVDRQFVEEAAMLHDIGIIFCDAPNILCMGTHPYIEHGYLGAELLRQEGLPRHASVAERHTGCGITMEQVIREDIQVPLQDYIPETLEERIICYADKFYSKTRIGTENTASRIRANMWKYGHDSVLRWDRLVAEMDEK